ncbi:MAG TPA: DeoR/GlpR family DNA-binding transcription regulator [Herpetosiphonaceae bacterium]
MTAAQAPDSRQPEVRRHYLLNLLQQEGQLSVRACSDALGVSEVTIRNDLALLEREGLLQRTWGGAMLRQQFRPEGAFMARLQQNRAEKERIAVAAAALVQDNDTIFLDASTTAYFMAQQLKDRHNLTVITNGMYTALELGPVPAITTIVIGGQVRGDTGSLVGTLSEELLQKLHVNKGFFSARGLTLAKGLMESTIVEGQLKELVIKHVDQVVAVVDASKLGSMSLTAFCPVRAIQCLITAGDDAARKAEPFRPLLDVVIG